MKNIYLHLVSRDELMKVDVSKIVYIEADGNYVNIILANQLKGSVCMSLSQIQSLLSKVLKEDVSAFVRIGKRYIVNSNYILKINVINQRLILSDGASFAFQLNISKVALKAFKDLYVKRISANQQ